MMRFPSYFIPVPALLGVPYVIGAIAFAVAVIAVDNAFGNPLARGLQKDHDEDVRDQFDFPDLRR